MKLNISCKGFEVTDNIRDRLEKKLSKLDKFFRKDAEADVRISQEKGNRNIVEITIAIGGLILRAEESSGDMYASIDGAVDKLSKQIRRHRTRLEKRFKGTSFEPAAFEADEEEEPVEEEAQYSVAKVKKFQVKAMPVEDAIAQMELLDHDFYMFRNEETDDICVLYRRNDGSYGVLQSE